MKTQKIIKRLAVKKSTIANLDSKQMGMVIGGDSKPCFVAVEKTKGEDCVVMSTSSTTYYYSCDPAQVCHAYDDLD